MKEKKEMNKRKQNNNVVQQDEIYYLFYVIRTKSLSQETAFFIVQNFVIILEIQNNT